MANEYFAHSAPQDKPHQKPHEYAEHVHAVEQMGIANVQRMLRYAVLAPEKKDRLTKSLQHALRIHDIGKLELRNQSVLSGQTQGKLPYDHVDGGVAVALENEDMLAAWLVRAHHAPGLTSVTDERQLQRRLRPSLKLRGKRHHRDDCSRDCIKAHKALITETDVLQQQLLKTHESTCAHTLGENQTDEPDDALTMRLLLSCLVDADHGDTAAYYSNSDTEQEIERVEPRWKERLHQLKQIVDELQGDDKDRQVLRDELFNQCLTNNSPARITTCAAPVGLGKTTSVIANLLKRAEENKLRRIFIIAPYTNVISQTAKTLRKYLVLDNEDPFALVAEHHHRVDFANAALRQYAQTWKAPIVVTTAVQFFETLANAGPTRLRKLHALPGAAIFVDESHACVPPLLMRQTWYWIKKLADSWSCHWVLASGSLVKFWENDEIVGEANRQTLPSLLSRDFFQQTQQAEYQRVEFMRFNEDKAVTKNELLNAVCSPDMAKGSRLIILNTVKSAAVVAQALQKRLQSDVTRDLPLLERIVLHISTALTPFDRERIIEEVGARQAKDSRWQKQDWYLVATSCVEAGVDLDFDFGFRERCSLTSFLQTAGRINREGLNANSVLYDFALIESDDISAHPAFSDSIDVFNSFWKELIDADTPLDDLSTCALIEEIWRKECTDQSVSNLFKAEEKCNFQKVQQQFKIIDSLTVTAVVNDDIQDKLEKGFYVNHRDIQNSSVQIWSNKIEEYGMTPCDRGTCIYYWNYDYDQNFLGYMSEIERLTRQGAWFI